MDVRKPGLRLAVIIAGMAGMAVIVALAVASPGSGGVSAAATCNTALAQAAGAGADSIFVSNTTGCDIGDSIVLNQGGGTEECQEIESVAAGAPMLSLVGTLAYGHSQGETVVKVPVCPTPTPTETETPPPTETPTPTPTPTPSPTETPTPTVRQVRGCPQAGKWAIASWDFPGGVNGDGVDTGEALATCGEGAVDAAYALDPDSQQWRRWFAGLPEMSNFETLKHKQGFLAFGSLVAAQRIAFSSDRDGNYEIYVMDTDGSDQTRRTNCPGGDYSPDWSPGGSKIAFQSECQGSNQEIHVMNASGSGLTRLTNDPAPDGGADWSPDGSKIAFQSGRDGNYEIYVMNADGSGQTRLTNNPADDSGSAWSPDGSKIAFTSDRDGNGEIYVMNANGTGQTRLTNNPAVDGVSDWSPDGSKIAFGSDRDGNLEVYVMNADGSGQTNLTKNSAADHGAAWSPDGTKIAFSSYRDGNYEIYVMNADGTGPTNLTNNPGSDWEPAWAPPTPSPTPTPTPGPGEMRNCPAAGKWSIAVWDGPDETETGEALATCGEGAVDFGYALDSVSQMWQGYFPGRMELSKKQRVMANEGILAHGMAATIARIAFSSDRDGDFEIYVMNADGSGQTQLTDNDVFDAYPAWSPDGTKIAFASKSDDIPPTFQIYVMNADGTGLIKLTNEGPYSIWSNSHPAWSPDGSKIAFTSDREESWEIWVMNADGSGQTRLTRFYGQDGSPTWSPDGTKIAFSSLLGGEHEERTIYMINSDGTMNADGTRLTKLTNFDPYMRWQHMDPAWSPDGSKIAFTSNQGGGDIWVVNPWVVNAGETRLTDDADDKGSPAWSPGGTKIAFTSDRDGNYEIYVMNADGTGQHNLTNQGDYDRDPAWSP
jgi:Tol biopolymer transport system component